MFFVKGKFVTNVYHKKTCSSVYTDFNKLIPKTYKTGLIKSLLFRYFSLYSDFVKFHHKINIFQKVFCIKVVPSVTLLIYALINFLTIKVLTPSIVVSTVSKKDLMIVLLCLGKFSLQIYTRINLVMNY